MFTETAIRDLLTRVAAGRETVEQAVAEMRSLPYDSTELATIDHHRALRQGFPEVIYCAPKTPAQVAQIARGIAGRHSCLLGTHATPAHYEAAKSELPELQYHELARAIWLDREPDRKQHPGVVLIAAGTGDLPVAEEAALALTLMGHAPRRINDVGVAGLHRLLPHVKAFQDAHAIIVIAGMDGALPSVVGGLVRCPVIAVPTSVGYGASFGGVAALLSMLNACAPGIGVMNIDNGYGAAHMAAAINRMVHEKLEARNSKSESNQKTE